MKFHKFLIGSVGILTILFSIFGWLFLMIVGTAISMDYPFLSNYFSLIFPFIVLIVGIFMAWYGFWSER